MRSIAAYVALATASYGLAATATDIESSSVLQAFVDSTGAFEMKVEHKATTPCGGQENGCTNITEGDGDCDRDSDCQAGLKCGKNNCRDFHSTEGWPDSDSAGFDFDDDCCYTPPTTTPSPSPSSIIATACGGQENGCTNITEGDGDCDRDSDCQAGLKCGKNNCRDFHSTEGWPDSDSAGFDFDDDCCYTPPTTPPSPSPSPTPPITRRRRRRRRDETSPSPSSSSTPALDAHGEMLHVVTSKRCVDVVLIGDYGKPGAGYGQDVVAEGMAKVAAEIGAESIHGIGDNIYESGAKTPQYMVDQWREPYMKYEGNRRPWYAVCGNHDWRTNARVERDFTNHSENTGGYWRMPTFWYKLTYATSSGMTVDMFHIDTEIWAKGKESQLRDPQKDWFKQELAKSTADWKIVLGHHAVYSAGSHGSTTALLSDLDPWMREHGVNIFAAGHDHSQHLIHHEDVYYIVTGAGAKSPRTGRKGYPDGALKIPVIQDENFGGLGFATLSFCEGEATLTFYAADGETQHHVVEIETPRAHYAPPVGALESDETGELCNGKQLSSVDLQCSACRVIVDEDPSETTCSSYCNSHELACSSAWDQDADGDSCDDIGDDIAIACDDVAIGNLVCECA